MSQISSPFASGGGGHAFENDVQTAFVVLMLTKGVVPGLSPWPIKKIKLQGKHADYNTDDFIAFVEDRSGCQKAKLLAQIKHTISITENDTNFSEVIKAAWLDFQNPTVFSSQCDAIALITGPLSATDIENVRRILEWARHSENAQEFLKMVNLANFSSDAKREKLQAFRFHLTKAKQANEGTDISDDEFWSFLKCFHLLGYDLDVKSGVTLSLLNSHIAQFQDDIEGLWSMIAKEVESFNHNAGTITIESIPSKIRNLFSERLREKSIPEEFVKIEEKKLSNLQNDISKGDYVKDLTILALSGGLNEKVKGDQEALKRLRGDE